MSALHRRNAIRFTLSTEDANKVLDSRMLRKAERISKHSDYRHNTYYDSPMHVLHKSGIVLRVAKQSGDHQVTVKLPRDTLPDNMISRKLSVPMKVDEPTLDLFSETEADDVLRQWRNTVELAPLFEADYQRDTLEFGIGKSQFELSIDRGVIRAGDKAQPISEARLKLVDGDSGELQETALALLERLHLKRIHSTKAERGYRLARPAYRRRAPKLPNPKLHAEQSVGEGFCQIARSALAYLYRNQDRTLEGDPEGVHQTRVAIRRIRAALKAFKKALPYDKRKAFNGEFRWFQQRFGPSRDWHVFLTETLPEVNQTEHDEAFQIRMKRLASMERKLGTDLTIRLMEGRRYARLLLQFEKWLTQLEQSKEPRLKQPIEPFARIVISKTLKDLLSDSRPLSRIRGDELHEIRKRGRKMRYATEFFAVLWNAPLFDELIGHLKTLQKELGNANDARTAMQLLAGMDPARVKTENLRIVRSWSGTRVKACARTAQPAWRKLHALGKNSDRLLEPAAGQH